MTAVTRVAVYSPAKDKLPAIAVAVDGKTVELQHADVAEKTVEQLDVALAAAAALSAVELPTVTIHVNRDGSLAVATGELGKGFAWPEDEEPDPVEVVRGG